MIVGIYTTVDSSSKRDIKDRVDKTFKNSDCFYTIWNIIEMMGKETFSANMPAKKTQRKNRGTRLPPLKNISTLL